MALAQGACPVRGMALCVALLHAISVGVLGAPSSVLPSASTDVTLGLHIHRTGHDHSFGIVSGNGVMAADRICLPFAPAGPPGGPGLLGMYGPPQGSIRMAVHPPSTPLDPPPPSDLSDHRGQKRTLPLGKCCQPVWYTSFWVPDPPPSPFSNPSLPPPAPRPPAFPNLLFFRTVHMTLCEGGRADIWIEQQGSDGRCL